MSRPNDARSESPMNPELSSMLEARPDAHELHAVYRAVPATQAPLSVELGPGTFRGGRAAVLMLLPRG